MCTPGHSSQLGSYATGYTTLKGLFIVVDGSNGGKCYLGERCALDKDAECVDVGIAPYGMCMCKNGSNLYSGFCRPGKYLYLLKHIFFLKILILRYDTVILIGEVQRNIAN